MSVSPCHKHRKGFLPHLQIVPLQQNRFAGVILFALIQHEQILWASLKMPKKPNQPKLERSFTLLRNFPIQ
ncbi:hypothetical protein SAMN05421882_11034 [Nitrosomonas communis]|uniref:Uncharacterized protein n=1 Tax=Nitrosomonas communis TaxID=44574 RepID=A0A1H2ZYS3_9PROT|nr:hypothetical protein SAMN05421882_11034 [Nitrosomonas communis]